jgi:uncharacterized membrane protein
MNRGLKRSPWLPFIPWLFVLLWSSGFIGSKLGVPFAEPFTFMTLRFVLVLAILVPIALLTRAPWPKSKAQMAHVAFAGLLIHALYLSGCVWSLRLGLPAGLLSLIVSMQPIFTAAFAGVVLGERVLPRQWSGLILGLIGTALVVAHKTGSGCRFPSASCSNPCCATATDSRSPKRTCATSPTGTPAPGDYEIPFVVARIVLQDFTGVPLLVDLAAMRSAVPAWARTPK